MFGKWKTKQISFFKIKIIIFILFIVICFLLFKLEKNLIILYLKKFKHLTIIYIAIIFILILKYDIFVGIKGYFYPGIIYNIGGICIFILFSLFSFTNEKMISLLKLITKFTGGIYYIHWTCFSILRRKFLFIKDRQFHGSIAIYIISYIFCYIGNKLTFNTKFKFLFN